MTLFHSVMMPELVMGPSNCKSAFSASLRMSAAIAGVLLLQGCASTLHQSVQAGDHEAVRQEIASGNSLEGSFMHGNPLNPAIENDDLEMVELLHDNGATILPAHLSVAVMAQARQFGNLASRSRYA